MDDYFKLENIVCVAATDCKTCETVTVVFPDRIALHALSRMAQLALQVPVVTVVPCQSARDHARGARGGIGTGSLRPISSGRAHRSTRGQERPQESTLLCDPIACRLPPQLRDGAVETLCDVGGHSKRTPPHAWPRWPPSDNRDLRGLARLAAFVLVTPNNNRDIVATAVHTKVRGP